MQGRTLPSAEELADAATVVAGGAAKTNGTSSDATAREAYDPSAYRILSR